MRARSLAYGRTHDAKKHDMGGGLSHTPPDGQAKATLNRAGNVDNYFEGFWLVLHTMAVAGTRAISPAPATPESRHTDPTQYVHCP